MKKMLTGTINYHKDELIRQSKNMTFNQVSSARRITQEVLDSSLKLSNLQEKDSLKLVFLYLHNERIKLLNSLFK